VPSLDAANVRRPFRREVGGFVMDPEEARRHPAACPDRVMERMRTAALKLGLSVQVGARKPATRLGGRPQDGTWERYVVVKDERLPEHLQEQTTVLAHSETWEDAARRLALWPSR
jgi:hypothetical protein